VPQAARANDAVWVPAILAVNLQITTFFFVAGLMLLERDAPASLGEIILGCGGSLVWSVVALLWDDIA
jgi:hypothetical protein